MSATMKSKLEVRVENLEKMAVSISETLSAVSRRLDSLQEHSLENTAEINRLGHVLDNIGNVVGRAADRFARLTEPQQIESVPPSIQIGAIRGN